MEEILAWIEEHGSEGIEYPLEVYLICYRILSATAQGDPSAIERAQAVLAKAHEALLDQAAKISDSALRRKFLEDVPVNREITAAWEERERSL